MRVKRLKKKKFKEKKGGLLKYNHEIIGILVLALGILVLLSLYFQNSVGIFGTFVKSILLGLLGLPSYIIPPIIIVYGVFKIFKRDDDVFNVRMIYISILLLLVSALIQTGFYNPKNYENLSIWSSMGQFYQEGRNLSGGGLLGGIISTPFLKIFQVLGTIIILTTLAVIDIILLTNMSIANFVRNIKAFFVDKYNASVEKIKEAKDNKEAENDKVAKNNKDEKLEIQKDNENYNIEIKPNKKVIDFKIEKNNREPKEKPENVPMQVYTEPEPISKSEPVELIMKDIKKQTGAGVKSIKEGVPTVEIPAPELHHNNTDYKYPSFNLLCEVVVDGQNIKDIKNIAIEGAKKLEDTLKSFGVDAKVINISRGPAVTRYELQPSPGVKVSKIVNLSDDISLNLAAAGVRIEAPIPGKAAIGIEVPNKEVTPIYLREVIESPEFTKFQSKLAFAIGKDISGDNVVADIAKMPHLLIAGATGSGKSVCINSLIMSLLYKASPDEVKLVMVDPKVVELGIYNGIPHLLIPVVTDPRKAAGALNWAVQEMVNRYKLFADKGVRDLKGYNAQLKDTGEQGILPQIVIIIDELADLMMVAPNDVEDAICRLAQMARAAGMHLIIATQRPSVDVITGVIKANIPSRISFAVSSQIDSRTILDMAGAEKLLGRGDMLFYPIGEPKPIRVKGAFVSDKEVENVVEFIKSQGKVEYNNDIIEEINSESEPEEKDPGDNDEFLPQAIELVVEAGQASVSLIQRKFKVGYARAARIVDQMEERGVVGPYEGSKPRQVLMTKMQLQEMQMAKANKV